MAATSRLDILIRAKDQASGALQRVNQQSNRMASSFNAARGPMIALGGAAAGAVLQFGRLGDEVQKMSIRTGFSTESLSELRFAMEQAGTSIQGFEVGVRRMSGFIEDAKDGLATSTDAMDKLGVSVDDLKGQSPEEAFFTLANAMAGVEDELTKAALAQDVFGRSGTQLLPLLAEGADGIEKLRQEARDLGIVMDQETANKAAKMQDAINSAKQSVNGLAISVGSTLAPGITLIAKLFSELPAPLRAAAVAAGVFFLAMKVGLISLRSAMVSTGIGALIIAVGILAEKFGLLGGTTDEATVSLDRYNSSTKALQEAAGNAGQSLTNTEAAFTALGLASDSAMRALDGYNQEVAIADELTAASIDNWKESAKALDESGARLAIVTDQLSRADTDLVPAIDGVVAAIEREGITLEELKPMIDGLNLSTETLSTLQAAAAVETAKVAKEVTDATTAYEAYAQGLDEIAVGTLQVDTSYQGLGQAIVDAKVAQDELVERFKNGNIIIRTSTEDTVVNLSSKWAAFHKLRQEQEEERLKQMEADAIFKAKIFDAQIANAKKLADAEIAEARRVAGAKIEEEQRVQGIFDTLRGRFKLDQQEALQQSLSGSLTRGEALGNLQSLLELRARTALSTDRRALGADVNLGSAGSLLGIGNNASGSGLDIVSQLGALPSSFEAVIQALARATGQQVQISMAPGAGDMIVAEVVNSQLNGAEL